MDRESRQRFKSLLLGLPGWNRGGSRKALLNDVFWGHSLLDRLRFEISGDEAADELIEELARLDAPDVDGLTAPCALLRGIREKFGAGHTREPVLTALEQALCQSASSLGSVLFLAAAPEDEDVLRTDREYKSIREALGGAAERKRMTLHPPELAVRASDLSRALLDNQPDIVHFAGHGGGEEGLYFEDEQGNARPVSGEALASVFRQFTHCVKLVILNACYTQAQAEAISEHIDFVIGTRQYIGDDTAIAFSVGFYQGLAAIPPRSVEDAFQLGCAQIRLEDLPEHTSPILMTGSGKVTTCQ